MGEKGGGGEGDKPDECLTFLYQLTEGAAGKSYGLNVARLAHIPAEILRVAATKSHQLEETITKRRLVGWLVVWVVCTGVLSHLVHHHTSASVLANAG